MGEAVLGWLIDHVKDSLVFEGSDEFVPFQSVYEPTPACWKNLIKYLGGFDEIDVFVICRYIDTDYAEDPIVIGVEIGAYRYDESLSELPQEVRDVSLKALNEFARILGEGGKEIPQPNVYLASEEIGHCPLSIFLE